MSDSMNMEDARAIVAVVIDQRRRWGNKLSLADFNQDEVLDALVLLGEEGVATAKTALTKANRQGAAYKAQATRWHKKMKENEAIIDDRGIRIAELLAQVALLQTEVKRLEALRSE